MSRAHVDAFSDALDLRDDGLAAMEKHLRVSCVADASRGAGGNDVTWGEGDDRRDVLNKRDRIEHELRSVRALHHLTIDGA